MRYTPFSTRLSGSARETELRLRNIFQWKRGRPPVMGLALALALVLGCGGLVACQRQTREGETLQPETQLRVLVQSRELWQAEEETDWWGYAVTDLDQNGRLEIISAEIHGSVHYNTTRIWEVNEAMEGLVACTTDESCVPVLGLETQLPAGYDPSSGRLWYILRDEVQDGFAHRYETLRVISLSEGDVAGNFLAFRDRERFSDDREETVYKNSQGEPITRQAYEGMTERAREELDPLTAQLDWITAVSLDELTDEALLERLHHSMEHFALSRGTMDPYQEILGRYRAAGALVQQDSEEARRQLEEEFFSDGRLVNSLLRPYWAIDHHRDFLSRIGYARQDLDGDGTEELLLGWIGNEFWNMDQGYVFAIYTLTDGTPRLAVEGWERCRYVLREDGTLCEEGSGGATEGSCIRFSFGGVPIEAIWHGWNEETKSTCYVYSDDPEEIREAAHPSTYTQWMDPEEAQRKMKEWMNGGVSIPCTPLADYEAEGNG